MSTQLLIYESAIPVSSARHRRSCVETGAGYAFSRRVNSAPLMAAEFRAAAREYAIVFAQVGDVVMPGLVLGMRDRENLYLDPQGSWQAKYIPAFIRCYPFIFASSDQGKTLTLCIDEAFVGCNQEGRGERLFTDDGQHTPYLDKVLQLLRNYQIEFRRTQAFCEKLKERELLEPMRAQVGLPSGGRLAMAGFMAVDRKKLRALSPETLGEMARTGELELIYLHLQSIHNFYSVRDRLVVIQGGKSGAAGEAVPAQGEAPQAAAA